MDVFNGFFNLVVSYLFLMTMVADSFNINLHPRQLINADSLTWGFRSNSSDSDHFKLLERDGQSLLVGARNTVYNLNMEKLTAQKMLEWPSTLHDMNMCHMKGKSEEDCHNYIRVLIKQSNGKVLACGTNAYKPTCRHYVTSEDGQYQMQREFSGFAISPYDPRHNSTALYLADRDELYSGTVSDFNAADPLIYRKPLSGSPTPTMSTELRTQRNNLKSLNEPNFISAVDDEDSVYFFLRESALEYNNCGKSTYARVARVCKNDQGGTRAYSDTWTTFMKARLNCSLPGSHPFYFDEIQATSTMTFGQYGSGAGAIIYAIFTTPYNGMQASAVCAFRMHDIRHVFAHSAFKSQASDASMWLPIRKEHVPTPRPGSCSHDSRKMGDDVVNFIQKNSLMEDAVPNFLNQPLIIDSNLRWRFTQITVHSNVRAVNGIRYDVVYIGTNDGRVLKLINAGNERSVSTVLIETVAVFTNGQSVTNLMVYTPDFDNDLGDTRGDIPNGAFASSSSEARLIVVSEDEVKVLPLHYCSNRTTCGSCVRLQDPYCAWDTRAERCVGRTDGFWADSEYKQFIGGGGQDAQCPGGFGDSEFFSINDPSAEKVTGVSSAVYSAQSMAIAVVFTMIIAAVLGAFIGYRLSIWKSSFMTEYASSSSSSTSTSSTGASVYGTTNHNRRGDLYLQHPKLTDSVNLMISLPDVKNEKNLLTLNNGTLPKDYKVKKVYL